MASIPSATTLSASMSSPESVSSRIAKRGWNMCICRISSRFFSPPENPSFTERVMNESSTPRSFIFSARSFRNCGIGMSFFLTSPVPSALGAARRALMAVRRKFATDTPGIADGYWNARLDTHTLPRRGRRKLRESHAIESLRDAVLELEPYRPRSAVRLAHTVQDRLALGGTDLRLDRPLERTDDVTGRDFARLPSERVAAAGATLPVHETGLAEGGDPPLEVGSGQVLTRRDGVKRDGALAPVLREVDH